MPIDRIKYIGLKVATGDVIVMRAGLLKYSAKEVNFEHQLIDGEHVYASNFLHLIFTVTAGYLSQQVLRSEEGDLDTDLQIETGYRIYTTDQPLGVILNALRAGTAEFFPRLQDQNGTSNFTKYAVVPDKKTIDLLNAKENGRFPMYTTLTFKTKTALTSYPSWINR